MQLLVGPEQIEYLFHQGCIQPLCDLLVCPDARIILVALEGLENILKVGDPDASNYISAIEEVGGLDKLESLQSHKNHEIYEKAVSILERYFAAEDEDETQNEGNEGNETPQQNETSFSFGTQGNLPGFRF